MILLYFTSILAIVSSILKGTASLVLSIVTIALACLFLCGDGIMFLGFAVSLNSTPMIRMGIAPLVNVLNLVSGILCLIGTILSRR